MTSNAPSDPFDDVLNIEERFYAEGYEQGTRDGIQAGKIEGRSVGLAKGFDKFLESGRLYGKAVVWGNRLQLAQQQPASEGSSASAQANPAPCLLPQIPNSNARLQKNVIAVGALVEPDTLATENTDEAVNDFDDRVKRAQGKAKIVERAIGEHTQDQAAVPAA
ncbi:hypothetical protein F5X68DRAFT_1283 [Plectosphaerella plurivora]|uniref:Essential protein Yae1 N-terminal domain-containing protein n=1 Tax=Plectosphaerella plurivora TaxID=936078 RepID=A0A9P8VK38_9PEZI|nr:hypothetical protein F5X68DRAFT_1283 [Plectosphaerella plurivora]